MAVRKNASAMTAVEQSTFIYVMNKLINAPGDPNSYGDMVGFHSDMSNMMHGSMGPVGAQRFLPWHRAYLLKLELLGQLIDPAFFIPYWDWSTSPAVPPWFSGFGPLTVKVAGANVTVTRNPPAAAPNNTLPTAAQVANCLAKALPVPAFTAFTNAVEAGIGVVPPFVGAGMHNRVHVWCNGTMSSVSGAPADPLFWLHHAMLDRMWSQWQVTHPGQNPALTGADAIMSPWQDTEISLRSITTLGYSYA